MTDGREPPTSAGRGTEPAPVPPAGLREPLPTARPGRGAWIAVLLALAAVAALWAALTGVGPADVDGAVLGDVIDVRSGGLTAAAIVLTDVGGTVSMAVLALAVGAWSWSRGRPSDAVLAVGAMAGAAVVFRLLKLLFDRPRPPSGSRLVTATDESLPSGHATMSIVVIGTLVVLAWAGRSVTSRVVIAAAAASWVGAVGATRIYLGVHWFSDVIAGWLVGAAWLAVCVAAWSWWRSRDPANGTLTA